MTDFQIVREYIASGNAQALDAMINGQQWERHFDTVHNAFAYIKKLPLFDAFGLTKSIHCLFHPDKHASANFFCGRNGEYLYHCFSPNCALNKAVSIIGFVRTIQGSTDNRAFRFLAKVCHVTWENRSRDTEDFIAHNRKFLANLPQNCPTAWPILRSHIAVLEALYRCLEEGVPIYYSDTLPVIGASQKQIAEHGGNSAKISRSLPILAYFGLIYRMSPYELSEERLDELIRHCKSRNQMRLIAQTKLLSLESDLYMQIEKKAAEWKKKHYTSSAFQYRAVVERDGVFQAARLFPGM